MSSTLKPLDQFSPDFALGFLLKGYCQLVQMALHYWTRWPPCPYMVKKKTLKSSSPEPRKFWGWILVYSIWDARSTKFVQVMILGLPLTFLWQGQISVLLKFLSYLLWQNLASAAMQWLFWSGERIVAHGPLVFQFQVLKTPNFQARVYEWPTSF